MVMQHIDIRVLGYRQYQLLSDIYVETSKYGIFLANGAIINGANIPQVLWGVIGCPLDFALEAATHDILYGSRILSRKECDKVFHELLIQQGVSRPKAKAMYLALRAGGQQAYDDSKDSMATYRDFIGVTIK